MIKTLHLHNYQAHVDNEIEFNPRITLIRGANNSNKSAIISSLETLLMGSELSVAHDIRWGEDSCQISVDLEDGNAITRVRSQKDNICRLRTKEGVMSLNTLKESKEYIYALSKCGTVTYDKNVGPEAIQFIQIYDSPFHMVRGMSAENRYKRLTQYIDSSKLVAIRGVLRSKLTASTGRLTDVEVRVKQLQQNLDDINAGEPIYEALNSKVKELQVNTVNKSTISTAIKNYTELISLAGKLLNADKLEEALLKYADVLGTKKALDSRLTYTRHLINNLDDHTRLTAELLELESQLQECPTCGQLIRV